MRVRGALAAAFATLTLTTVAAAPASAAPPHNRVDAAAATTWLAQPAVLAGYIGDGTEAYAGATAKAALAVQVRGQNPASFGGVDLLARLRGLLGADGRFTDRSAFGDFSNAFSQSFGILALEPSGGAPNSAVAFLAASRCTDGGFPLQFAQPVCDSDVDSTAMAVQALIAAGRRSDAAPGIQWLVSNQAADGSFAAFGTANTNSTGLAAQALAAAGRPVAWQKARQFILSLQVGCDGAAEDRGAIAYSPAGFDPSTAPRATAQAVPGAAGAPFADLSGTGAAPGAPSLARRSKRLPL
ncbi:prenyltransferase/squalene oxidase repeat-containing protein [Asanoa ishikariensis]|nr:prenyltransferase/squalene oxidase repeat-containing protein [Asanoa ishikariensis]